MKWLATQPRSQQRGFSLIGMLFSASLVVFIGLLLLRVVPALLEYYTIRKDANLVVTQAEMRVAPLIEVRQAFMQRLKMDDIHVLNERDLDLTKEATGPVIAFAYARKIPLFGSVSLLIDFEGRSTPGV